MGIRIHKAIGYAAKHPDRRALEDSLWENPNDGEVEAFIRHHYDPKSNDENFMLAFELPQIKSQNETIPLSDDYPKRFSDIVRYASYPDEEDGYYLIIPPVMLKEWFRYNNSIDYADFNIHHKDMSDIFVELDYPFYPYLNWMNPTTGQKIKDYNDIINRERYIEDNGYKPVPMPPLVVRLIAEKFGFDWKALRPAYAIWWS